jgi:hypothetical protein
MNNIIPLRAELRKHDEHSDKGRRRVRLEVDLPAHLRDRLLVRAGFALKSPNQWAADALSTVLEMDLAG